MNLASALTANCGNNGTLYYGRRIVVRCGNYPIDATIYYYSINQWRPLLLGPGKPEATLILAQQQAYPSGCPLAVAKPYEHYGPISTVIKLTTDTSTTTVQFAASQAAQTQGPLVIANCDLVKETIDMDRRSSGSSSPILVNPVPVYINPIQIEGQFGLWVDPGAPTDTDGDGIPDSEDEDDDGDGRNDFSDKFPLDPDEKDDTDNDGLGDNADPDDDNDGVPDTEDDFPYDPGQNFSDRDGDGIRDSLDEFPDNGRESSDSDGDGVGNNSDPDDDNDGLLDTNDPKPTIPDTRPGITPVPPGSVGDGQGNPGIGDGAGGPGPQPAPGGGGGGGEGDGDQIGTGTSGISDESGEVKPGSAQDVAGAVGGAKGIVPGKIANFRPLGSGFIPYTSSYTIDMPFGKLGSHQFTFHFDQPPFTHMRQLMLIVVVYMVGRDCFKRLSI